MRSFKFLLLLFVLLSGFGASSIEQRKAPSIKQLHWLKGKWSRVSAGVEHIETWQIKKDSLLEVEGYYLKSDNKKVTEKLSIRWEKGELYYVADVPENKMPVYFKNTILNDSVAVFENRSHDYPNKITYIKESKRSFQVILNDNSGTKTRKFSFKLVTKR